MDNESPQKEQAEDSKVVGEDSKAQPEDSGQPEFEALDNEQAAEAVEQLISDEQPAEEKAQEKVEDEAPAEEETQVEEPEIPIIDEELVAKYPVLRAYYGKPVTDIAQGYNSIVKKYMDRSKEFAEMQKQMDIISLQKTDDMPDPVDKPEEFKQWLKDFAKKNQEVGAQEKVEPQIDVMSELAKRLPPDTDVQKVTQEWMNENAERLYDEMGNFRPEIESLYQRNPEILYAEVIKFNQKYEKENQDEAVERKAGHKKLKTDFKKARNSKKEMPGAQVNTISKDVKLTPEEEMLIEINELVQE